MIPEVMFIGKKGLLLDGTDVDTWYLFSYRDRKYVEIKLWRPGEEKQDTAYSVMSRIVKLLHGDRT